MYVITMFQCKWKGCYIFIANVTVLGFEEGCSWQGEMTMNSKRRKMSDTIPITYYSVLDSLYTSLKSGRLGMIYFESLKKRFYWSISSSHHPNRWRDCFAWSEMSTQYLSPADHCLDFVKHPQLSCDNLLNLPRVISWLAHFCRSKNWSSGLLLIVVGEQLLR